MPSFQPDFIPLVPDSPPPRPNVQVNVREMYGSNYVMGSELLVRGDRNRETHVTTYNHNLDEVYWTRGGRHWRQPKSARPTSAIADPNAGRWGQIPPTPAYSFGNSGHVTLQNETERQFDGPVEQETLMLATGKKTLSKKKSQPKSEWRLGPITRRLFPPHEQLSASTVSPQPESPPEPEPTVKLGPTYLERIRASEAWKLYMEMIEKGNTDIYVNMRKAAEAKKAALLEECGEMADAGEEEVFLRSPIEDIHEPEWTKAYRPRDFHQDIQVMEE